MRIPYVGHAGEGTPSYTHKDNHMLVWFARILNHYQRTAYGVLVFGVYVAMNWSLEQVEFAPFLSQ